MWIDEVMNLFLLKPLFSSIVSIFIKKNLSCIVIFYLFSRKIINFYSFDMHPIDKLQRNAITMYLFRSPIWSFSVKCSWILNMLTFVYQLFNLYIPTFIPIYIYYIPTPAYLYKIRCARSGYTVLQKFNYSVNKSDIYCTEPSVLD